MAEYLCSALTEERQPDSLKADLLGVIFLFDYHVHSHHSVDSNASIADQCHRALELGLREVVFTEHFDLQPREEGKGHFNYVSYSEEISECLQNMGGLLRVKKGLEIGEPHLYQREIADFLHDKKFDFLLGSVHWVGDRATHEDYCSSRAERLVYEDYFNEVNRAVQAGGFHVLGHLDLPKRYAPDNFRTFNPEDYTGSICEVLQALIKAGIGIEVNTSGLRQPCAVTFPDVTVLFWYRQLGGEIITVGSDAHHPWQVGWQVYTTIEMLKELGYKAVTTFDGGKAIQVPLP